MSWPWEAVIVALWVLLLVLAVMVLGLMRRMAPVLARAEKAIELQQTRSPQIGGLKPSSEVPPFEVIADRGKVLRLGEDLKLPAVFLFVESGCPPCKKLAVELGQQASTLSGLRLYVLTDAESLLREEFKVLRERGLLLFEQRERAASRAFQQEAFPQAFAVDASRKVKNVKVPTTVEDLKVLAERVAAYRGKEVKEESVIKGRRM